MAKIVTLRILVDEPEDARVYDGINEMLRNAQMGEPNNEDGGLVVDWSIGSVDETIDELGDSIANGIYAEGDAFRDWVIFSRSEAVAQDGAGYWSNEYGWTTLDLATKFDAVNRDRPHSAGMDAAWMLVQYKMEFYRLLLVEFPDDQSLDQTPIAFECWAENLDHAIEQAGNAYPGCLYVEKEIPA